MNIKHKYPELRQKFEKYLNNKENDETMNQIKDEIKLLMYNQKIKRNDRVPNCSPTSLWHWDWKTTFPAEFILILFRKYIEKNEMYCEELVVMLT